MGKGRMCENVWCGSQWVPVIGMCSQSVGVVCVRWVNDTHSSTGSVPVEDERRAERTE